MCRIYIFANSDWGHAKDYIKGMWLMVQRDEPSDYVLSTGECHSVREFVQEVRWSIFA